MAAPANLLRGGGLKCCRGTGRPKSPNKKPPKRAPQTNPDYVKALAAIGKAEALQEYQGSHKAIYHLCLLHNEVHKASPRHTLRGTGFECCRLAAARKRANRQNVQACFAYEGRLAEFGRVEALEPYVDSKTPILHRCLKHGEIHRVAPAEPLKGKGLVCCRAQGDSFSRLKSDKEWADSPCHVYVARINGLYLKPGIARDAEARAKTNGGAGYYSGFAFISPTITRAEAWAIEARLLQESRAAKPAQLPEQYNDWAGYTELRIKAMLPESWYISRFWELLEEMHEVGWEELVSTCTHLQ